MRVCYLPPMAPEEGEAPRAFAGRVRAALAAELRRDTTEHGHDDERLQKHAARALRARGEPREPAPKWALPEMGLVKDSLGLTCADAKSHLDLYLDARDLDVAARDDYLRATNLRPDGADGGHRLYASRVAANMGERLSFREFLAAAALRSAAADVAS